MSDQRASGFPRELLVQPLETRRHYFETKVVAHRRLKEVYEARLACHSLPGRHLAHSRRWSHRRGQDHLARAYRETIDRGRQR